MTPALKILENRLVYGMLWASHQEGGSTPPLSRSMFGRLTEPWLSRAGMGMNMPETGSKHPRREENCWSIKKLSQPECWHRRRVYQRRKIDLCAFLERLTAWEWALELGVFHSWEAPTKCAPAYPCGELNGVGYLPLFVWSRPNSVHLTLLLMGFAGYLAGSNSPVRVPVACGMTGLPSLQCWSLSKSVSSKRKLRCSLFLKGH